MTHPRTFKLISSFLVLFIAQISHVFHLPVRLKGTLILFEFISWILSASKWQIKTLNGLWLHLLYSCIFFYFFFLRGGGNWGNAAKGWTAVLFWAWAAVKQQKALSPNTKSGNPAEQEMKLKFARNWACLPHLRQFCWHFPHVKRAMTPNSTTVELQQLEQTTLLLFFCACYELLPKKSDIMCCIACIS